MRSGFSIAASCRMPSCPGCSRSRATSAVPPPYPLAARPRRDDSRPGRPAGCCQRARDVHARRALRPERRARSDARDATARTAPARVARPLLRRNRSDACVVTVGGRDTPLSRAAQPRQSTHHRPDKVAVMLNGFVLLRLGRRLLRGGLGAKTATAAVVVGLAAGAAVPLERTLRQPQTRTPTLTATTRSDQQTPPTPIPPLAARTAPTHPRHAHAAAAQPRDADAVTTSAAPSTDAPTAQGTPSGPKRRRASRQRQPQRRRGDVLAPPSTTHQRSSAP